MRSRFRRRRRRFTSRRRHFKRRLFRRTRFRRRRLRGRGRGAIAKLMKHLLPKVPIRWVKTENLTGAFSSRQWYCFEPAGTLSGLVGWHNYLPNVQNIFGSLGGTASTNLSVDNFNSVKFRAKYIQRFSVQNISNLEGYATLYIMKFRKDTPTEIYTGANNAFTTMLDDAGIASHYQTNANSSLPTPTSYIGAIYNYPAFTVFDSSKTCSLLKVIKTRKMRVGPGETFHFRVATKTKEFSSAYIFRNNTATNKVEYAGNWSKVAWLSWHGPVCQKAGDATTQVLGAVDFLSYCSSTLVLKAVATHTPSKVYFQPVNLTTASPLAFVPVVRPKGVIQITETTANAEQKG